jgi:flagellar biosynthesis/type III secretory pathway M-ring protein FliF/YscJ
VLTGLPPEPEITDADKMRAQLMDMVDESPDVAADLIKRWLITE